MPAEHFESRRLDKPDSAPHLIAQFWVCRKGGTAHSSEAPRKAKRLWGRAQSSPGQRTPGEGHKGSVRGGIGFLRGHTRRRRVLHSPGWDAARSPPAASLRKLLLWNGLALLLTGSTDL